MDLPYEVLHIFEEMLQSHFGRPVYPELKEEVVQLRKKKPGSGTDASSTSTSVTSTGGSESNVDGPPASGEPVVDAFFTLDDVVATKRPPVGKCVQCTPRAKSLKRPLDEICPVNAAQLSLRYVLRVDSPFGVVVPVTVDAFIDLSAVFDEPLAVATAGVQSPDGICKPFPPLYTAEDDENAEAKEAVVVLFKAWKYDSMPLIPSHHVVWAVDDCTKVYGVNFDDRAGTFHGKVTNVFRGALRTLADRYRDVTQPTMFRKDFNNDALMIEHSSALRALFDAIPRVK